ncbi:MAG: hypothetical protein ACLRL0_01645 [Christensenellaceae bacterium]
MKFCFGDIVVVEGGLIGVVVKSWGKSFLGKPRNYDVYVRSWNIIQNYDEEDIERYKAMVERRKTNFELSVTDFLDLDFFSVAKAGGTAATALGVTDLDSTKSFKRQIETLIGKFEKTGKNGTENKYVRGIDRRYMALILDSSLYGLVKDELNDCRNFSQMISDEKFTGINGVACFSSVNLPDGVDYELMTMDSIAQPVLPSGFEFEKIPLSIEYAMEMFFRYGSKVLAPELVLHGKLAADAA